MVLGTQVPSSGIIFDTIDMANSRQEEDSFGIRGASKSTCRSCTDFKEWSANFKQSNTNEAQDSKSSIKSPSTITTEQEQIVECPLDRQKLGRYSWSILHTVAAHYPETPTTEQKNDVTQFMHLFTKLYPCKDCSDDFKDRLAGNPPATESYSALSQWLCMMHNQVNTKLGKPIFDCSLIDQRWKDGWKDGSCD